MLRSQHKMVAGVRPGAVNCFPLQSLRTAQRSTRYSASLLYCMRQWVLVLTSLLSCFKLCCYFDPLALPCRHRPAVLATAKPTGSGKGTPKPTPTTPSVARASPKKKLPAESSATTQPSVQAEKQVDAAAKDAKQVTCDSYQSCSTVDASGYRGNCGNLNGRAVARC